jgi:hypothetical protein
MHTRRHSLGLAAVLGVASLALAIPNAFATGHPPIAFGPVGGRAAVAQGELFFKAIAYNVQYNAGETMTWSGNADGSGLTAVDDVARIVVKHADGTRSQLVIDYSHQCAGIEAEAPRDVSSLFRPGANTVVVTYRDLCGGNLSAEPAYLS